VGMGIVAVRGEADYFFVAILDRRYHRIKALSQHTRRHKGREIIDELESDHPRAYIFIPISTLVSCLL